MRKCELFSDFSYLLIHIIVRLFELIHVLLVFSDRPYQLSIGVYEGLLPFFPRLLLPRLRQYLRWKLDGQPGCLGILVEKINDMSMDQINRTHRLVFHHGSGSLNL